MSKLMLNEKTIKLLNKLNALTLQGIGGEKLKIKARIATLMDEYGLTEDDLQNEKLTFHAFSYKGKYQRRLLIQAINTVTNRRNVFSNCRGKGPRSQLWIRCTEIECFGIVFLLALYSRILEKELELFRNSKKTKNLKKKRQVYPRRLHENGIHAAFYR